MYKLFLQVMDYGKLTDSKGREINFKNVLIIMTSNAGVVTKTKSIGIGAQDNKTPSIDTNVINNLFSPEFRGRLTGNGPIEFKPLNEKVMTQIVNKYVAEIQETRLNKLKIKLELSDEVVNYLAKMGLEKNLGARPVKDYIESKIIDELTDEVLFGKLKNLNEFKTVKIILKEDKIHLKY